jgi:uncharacterized alpha-E superfamily protein
MLSRVADNLYWMSRYLERAEHTTRQIDVNLHQMLEETGMHTNVRWELLLESLHMPPSDEANDAYSMTQLLAFDASNSSSIVSCIAAARENARQIREQISSEMWEQLNRLYLRVSQTTMEEVWFAEPHTFFSRVKEGIHLFQGITDATMSHSEGWHFIRLGRFLERAMATASLLDVYFTQLLSTQPSTEHDSGQPNYLYWVGLLRSCAAFEAYCKVYTAAMQPDHIVEFLLLNAESPRSIRFAASMMQAALQAIARATNTRSPSRAERVVGRLRASLDYDQVEEIMNGSLHAYLENIRLQCRQIHDAIYQTYISYPIDVAITLRGAAQA